jgi:hypothetical protein
MPRRGSASVVDQATAQAKSRRAPAPRTTPSEATRSPAKLTSAPKPPGQRADRIEERAREDRATLERQLADERAAEKGPSRTVFERPNSLGSWPRILNRPPRRLLTIR